MIDFAARFSLCIKKQMYMMEKELYQQLREQKTNYAVRDLGDGMLVYEEVVNGYWRTRFLLNTKTQSACEIVGRDLTLKTFTPDDVDMENVGKFEYARNARNMTAHYMFTIYPFEDGVAYVSWTLHPDGMYFMDADGYGMEACEEETIGAYIDTDCRVLIPFQDMDDKHKRYRLHKEALNKRNDMKQRIYNLIIIDESGSMQSIRKEAIDSVNETIQTIHAAQKKHLEQEHNVSLVTFNDDVKTVCDCVSVNQVQELTEETYQPCCCTALYDAMGMSLTTLRKKVTESDKVLVTIVTDGYENASKEYDGKAIKSLVDELKDRGWVFAYIGANQDVEAVAATISITNVMNFEASSAGTADMGHKLSGARSRLYDRMSECCFSADEANKDFFDEV